MSHHVESWAWKQRVGDDGAKLVLVKLASQANDDGVSFPSQRTLTVECESSAQTIKRRIRMLRESRLLIVVPWFDPSGRQTSSMYVIPFEGVPSSERLGRILSRADRRGSAGDVVELFPGRGSLVTPSPVSPVTPSGVPPATPSIEEPSQEPREPEGSLLPAEPGVGGDRFQIELALSAALGVQLSGMTDRERDQWNLAIADLVKVGATADEVSARCRAYRETVFPNARLTPLALTRHWSLLGADESARAATTPPCPDCGLGGGNHVDGCPAVGAPDERSAAA